MPAAAWRQVGGRVWTTARFHALGLLSEDMAFEDGEGWGNFPQTYSHVGLINAAMRLSRSWQEAS